MTAIVQAVAGCIWVSPGEVLVWLGRCPDDLTDLWDEDGGLFKVGIDEVHEALAPACARTVPELEPPS